MILSRRSTMTTRLLGRLGDRTQSARNQHALRAATPRTPTPMLLALLRACSFRLESEAVAWPVPLGAWLGRSATSCGPLVPRLRNRSVSRCQPPTENARNEERRFYSETAGGINQIAKTSSAYTPTEMQSRRSHIDLFQAQSADLPWPLIRVLAYANNAIQCNRT